MVFLGVRKSAVNTQILLWLCLLLLTLLLGMSLLFWLLKRVGSHNMRAWRGAGECFEVSRARKNSLRASNSFFVFSSV